MEENSPKVLSQIVVVVETVLEAAGLLEEQVIRSGVGAPKVDSTTARKIVQAIGPRLKRQDVDLLVIRAEAEKVLEALIETQREILIRKGLEATTIATVALAGIRKEKPFGLHAWMIKLASIGAGMTTKGVVPGLSPRSRSKRSARLHEVTIERSTMLDQELRFRKAFRYIITHLLKQKHKYALGTYGFLLHVFLISSRVYYQTAECKQKTLLSNFL